MKQRELKPLTDFYQRELEDRVAAITSGKFMGVREVWVPGWGKKDTCSFREKDLAYKMGIVATGVLTEHYLTEPRRRAFSSILLEAMVNAEETVDEGVAAVLEKIDIPLVQDAYAWAKQNGGVDKVTKRAMRSWLVARKGTTLCDLMSGVGALMAVTQYPDKLDDISGEDKLSAYAVHRLFITNKPSPKKELELEIAITIANIVPEELSKKLGRIEEYMCGGRPSNLLPQLDKYNLNGAFALKWKRKDPDAEKELDALYGDEETKRKIYYALYDCLLLVRSFGYGPNGGAAELPSKSPFLISPRQYAILRGAVRNFAINQIAYVWREHGRIMAPQLAQRIGMSVRGGQRGINITYKTARFPFRKGTDYRNTSQYLPIAVYVLNTLYQGAQKLLRSNGQSKH